MTAATVASRVSMRRRLAQLALILSLVLNLFFIGGAVWFHIHARAPRLGFAERLHQVGAGLNLDPRQRAGFERYIVTVRRIFRQRHAEMEPLIRQAWSELGKPDAKEADVMRIVDQVAEMRRDSQHKLAVATFSFLATLTPEQRAEFVARARRRTNHHHHEANRPATAH